MQPAGEAKWICEHWPSPASAVIFALPAIRSRQWSSGAAIARFHRESSLLLVSRFSRHSRFSERFRRFYDFEKSGSQFFHVLPESCNRPRTLKIQHLIQDIVQKKSIFA
jgi:hypothetical protein